MTKVLQACLDQSLLESISSDEDFQNLQRAAQDLSESLLDDRAALLSSTIAALDPSVSEEDANLVRAEEAVKKHWNTFRNRFHAGAAFALRAVIFEALAQACESSIEAAATVWYVGGVRLQHADKGEIGEVVEQIIISAGETTETAAQKGWSIPSEPEIDTISNVKFDASEVDLAKIDKDALAKGLQAAVAPQDTNGNNLGVQSDWPSNSNTSRARKWGKKFADKAADSIVESVLDPKISNTVKVAERVESALRSHSHAIRRVVRDALKDVLQRMKVQKQRADLMWWMRTKYSPLLRCSYREIPLPQRLMTMALDLHSQVPKLTPQSVEYLLREYVREMEGGGESLTLREFMDDLSSDVPSPLAQSLEDAISMRGERTTIPGFAAGIIGGRFSLEELESHVGPLCGTKIPVSELAVCLFSDLQAEQLAIGS